MSFAASLYVASTTELLVLKTFITHARSVSVN